jgi:large subunit ribosomal protein L20
MSRVKGGVNAKKRHKKILKQAKGYVGAASRQYRVAKQSVMRAMANAFVGRKQIKREYRRIWIVRINAAARQNGITYGKLIHGIKEAGIEINRKMLSELAINNADAFEEIVSRVKSNKQTA